MLFCCAICLSVELANNCYLAFMIKLTKIVIFTMGVGNILASAASHIHTYTFSNKNISTNIQRVNTLLCLTCRNWYVSDCVITRVCRWFSLPLPLSFVASSIVTYHYANIFTLLMTLLAFYFRIFVSRLFFFLFLLRKRGRREIKKIKLRLKIKMLLDFDKKLFLKFAMCSINDANQHFIPQ